MKGLIALRRTRARRWNGGFTLIELMVVVILIALIAMLAAPSFSDARNDRLAFSYARTVGEMVHNARARAAGRGAAHLVVWTNGSGLTRGVVYVFEGLDGVGNGATPPGPNPSPSCKTPGQWAFASSFTPGAVDGNNRAAIVDALNINGTAVGSITVKEQIFMQAATPDPVTKKPTALVGNAFVICTTPNGTTYYGAGSGITDAVTAMQAAGPFTGAVEIDVARHSDSAGANIIGLNRRVMMTGGAAPRIMSQ